MNKKYDDIDIDEYVIKTIKQEERIDKLEKINEELKERLEFHNDDYTSVYLKGCADTKEKYQQVIDKLRKYLVDTIPSSFDVAEYSVARIKDILKEVE